MGSCELIFEDGEQIFILFENLALEERPLSLFWLGDFGMILFLHKHPYVLVLDELHMGILIPKQPLGLVGIDHRGIIFKGGGIVHVVNVEYSIHVEPNDAADLL